MANDFPDTIIVVGAAVFGLSSALVIAGRYPLTKITVIDRHTPPVQDGASVDTSKVLRPDYVDKVHEKLADKAQALIKDDPELQPVNAEGMIKVYYDRCCQKPNINFVIGSPVDRLLYGACSSVDGIILEDGRELRAQKTILATGA